MNRLRIASQPKVWAVTPPLIASNGRSSSWSRHRLVVAGSICSLFTIAYNGPLIARSSLWIGIPFALLIVSSSRLGDLRIPSIVMALVAWLIISTLSNDIPSGSGYTLPLLTSSILSAIALGSPEPESLRRLVVAALGAPLILSSILLSLNVGREPLSRVEAVVGWRGLFDNKNSLGICAGVLLVVLILSSTKAGKRHRVLLILTLTLLLASRSSTAIASLLFSVSTIVLGRRIISARVSNIRRLLLTLVVVALEVAVALFGSSLALEALGRDTTITGRTEIWHEVIPIASSPSFVGYGPGAFWPSSDGQKSASTIESLTHFRPGQAHNGWLDAILDLGYFGAALLAVLLISATFVALRSLQENPWQLGIILFFFAASLTERGIYSSLGIFLAATILLSTKPHLSPKQGRTPRSQRPTNDQWGAPQRNVVARKIGLLP